MVNVNKKLFQTLFLYFVFALFTLFAGCHYVDENDFTKPIHSNDLEIEYTVYGTSHIAVDVTFLEEMKDVRFSIMYYQSNNILHQHSEFVTLEHIKKGSTYYYDYDLEDYPLDRVMLGSLTGHKQEKCIDSNEKDKCIGTIKSDYSDLNPNQFSFRLDTSYSENTVIGRIYITSSIDIWDAKIHFAYVTSENKNYGQYIDIEKMKANEETCVLLKKLISDSFTIKTIEIESAYGRITAPLIVTD